jgi:hypothetical protein
VTITSPTNGATVAIRSSVSIAASATDAMGVSRVEFYVNGNLKCTDSSAPYSCAWSVPKARGKSYQIKAVGYDLSGNAGSSPIISVSSR